MAKQQTERRALDPRTEKIIRLATLAVLALVMAGAVLLSVFSIRNENLRNKLIFSYSGDLQKLTYPIDLSEADQAKKIKITDRHGQTAKFRYYCEKYLHMQAYYAESAIQFGSVSSNDCNLVFYIFDEDDVLLYRSDGIEPGQYVHSIRLIESKPAGRFACRLYVAAFDRQTNAYLGAQYSDLTLIIGG